jgi:DNA-binding NarL/FixJ family response regulator
MLAPQESWQICGEAATGHEAVDKAIRLKPDIVVMDFGLPELDGLDATRRIRNALPETEVLILTMHDSEQLTREAFLAGAKAFVVKTDTRRHLIPAVQTLALHKPFLTSAASTVVLSGFLSSKDYAAYPTRRNGGLTQRERQIVELIAGGWMSKEIAAKLGISVRTVEAHRTNVMRKLGLHSVSDLVRYAIRQKLIQG